MKPEAVDRKPARIRNRESGFIFSRTTLLLCQHRQERHAALLSRMNEKAALTRAAQLRPDVLVLKKPAQNKPVSFPVKCSNSG